MRNGFTSEDEVIRSIADRVSTAEKKIAEILHDLGYHVKVYGMDVSYNFTTRGKGHMDPFAASVASEIKVSLLYRIT